MYTLDSLKEINAFYDSLHRVEQSDVDVANKFIEAIQKSRTDDMIQVGDIVEITTQYGDYFKNAHFASYNAETATWSVCEIPHVPFVFTNKSGGISYSNGGGAWCEVPNKLKLLGKREKEFRVFGHYCAHGAFYFYAEVNVWEYKHDDLLYGNYTTKDWRRFYVSYCVDEHGNPKNGSPYRYVTNGSGFEDRNEYEAWLKTFRGVEFKSSPNHAVVFCYRQRDFLISKGEWDELDLPMDTRFCNGINLCKVRYDDETNTVDVYRFSNRGELDQRCYRLYELARGRDLSKEVSA